MNRRPGYQPHDTDASARIRQLLHAIVGQLSPRLVLIGNDIDALRALLSERDAIQQMLPPICAHCGERNRDGAHDEHDSSWMCAPCYLKGAREAIHDA